ncbi:hypothetical protein pb186bvf_014728 [Paramecium bursaria]
MQQEPLILRNEEIYNKYNERNYYQIHRQYSLDYLISIIQYMNEIFTIFYNVIYQIYLSNNHVLDFAYYMVHTLSSLDQFQKTSSNLIEDCFNFLIMSIGLIVSQKLFYFVSLMVTALSLFLTYHAGVASCSLAIAINFFISLLSLPHPLSSGIPSRCLPCKQPSHKGLYIVLLNPQFSDRGTNRLITSSFQSIKKALFIQSTKQLDKNICKQSIQLQKLQHK